jgi:hypothetical protein
MSKEHAEKLCCQESGLKASKACLGYSSFFWRPFCTIMSNEHAETLFCQESGLKASKACQGYSSWLTAILHDQG